MKKMLLLALAALLLHTPGHAAELDKIRFRPADKHKQLYRATIDGYTLEMQDPGEASPPSVWDSPLFIRHQGRLVGKSEALLITDVYYIKKTGTLIIQSYSGSQLYLDFLDLRTATKKHPQIEFFSEKLIIAADKIIAYPGCECTSDAPAAPDEAPCLCAAARVFDLDAHSLPVENKHAGYDLTKQIIGVTFEGDRAVLHPKSPSAVLLPDDNAQQ
ncbi:hypothetical protein [Uliginosibacterium gangwonense]|uniref:hypothetical protein n=1 Tax=Uliginosibacterium gangwonense TaxID=392736 RepID=UPI000361936D|nr:hypothetical protein [Uliginosibacterium gangwonense]